MEAINCLRVELAEELEELPVALQSMFPDLGTDFLYSVFHDVMETSLVCRGDKDGAFYSGKKGRQLERDMIGEEDGSPVAKRTRRSHLKSEDDEDKDSAQGHCLEEVEVEDAWVVMLEDAMEEIHSIHEKLNHMDATSVEYPNCFLERVRSDRDGKGTQNNDVSLVRCVICKKTIDRSGMEPHVKHCRGRQEEPHEIKEVEKQNAVSDSVDIGTSSLGRAQSGDEYLEETTKASQNSNTKKVKQTMSNIAPIVINNSQDYSVLPLSPVLKAASTARQGRSSGLRRRRSDPVASPTTFASTTRPSVGCAQGQIMNTRPSIGYPNGMPFENHTFGHQTSFIRQQMPPVSMQQQQMQQQQMPQHHMQQQQQMPQHHMPISMQYQNMPWYQGERLVLNPEQKQFLESQQLRNHIQFLQQQQGMYMMNQGREVMHVPQNAQEYPFGIPPAMGQPPNIVMGTAVNGQHRMSPQQIYQNILSMQQANRFSREKHEESH